IYKAIREILSESQSKSVSQAEIARRIGIDITTLNEWLKRHSYDLDIQKLRRDIFLTTFAAKIRYILINLYFKDIPFSEREIKDRLKRQGISLAKYSNWKFRQKRKNKFDLANLLEKYPIYFDEISEIFGSCQIDVLLKLLPSIYFEDYSVYVEYDKFKIQNPNLDIFDFIMYLITTKKLDLAIFYLREALFQYKKENKLLTSKEAKIIDHLLFFIYTHKFFGSINKAKLRLYIAKGLLDKNKEEALFYLKEAKKILEEAVGFAEENEISISPLAYLYRIVLCLENKLKEETFACGLGVYKDGKMDEEASKKTKRILVQKVKKKLIVDFYGLPKKLKEKIPQKILELLDSDNIYFILDEADIKNHSPPFLWFESDKRFLVAFSLSKPLILKNGKLPRGIYLPTGLLDKNFIHLLPQIISHEKEDILNKQEDIDEAQRLAEEVLKIITN
ncbi:MAG: hypothetical protein QXZ20_04100, partial [Candidatus Aenigmatarchaeota archaeon]